MTMVPAVAAATAAVTGLAAAESERGWARVLDDAGDVVVRVHVSSESRLVSGADARWIVEADVLGWGDHDSPQGACAPRGCPSRASGVLTAVADAPLAYGQVATLAGSVDLDDDGGAIMWRAAVVDAEAGSWIGAWRDRFMFATRTLPDRQRGLLQGMILGDTSQMPTREVDAMRVAGLAHLTAVSGAHFAIVLGAVGAAARSLRLRRLSVAAIVLAVASAFATVVGPEPSVLRALAMAGAVALGIAWGRPARGLPALAAGVLVLVIVEPRLALEIGFAMSVAAVAAIVLWAPRLAHLLSTVMPPSIARAASIPLAAQAAVTPLLVSIGAGLTPYAVIANLVAGIAVLPVMAAGMAALVLAPVSASAAAAAAWLAGHAAGVIAVVADVVSRAPAARLPWPEGVGGTALAAVAVLGLILASHRLAVGWRVLGALACAASLAAGGVAHARTVSDHAVVVVDWGVVACDVGQGDMMLLRAGPSSAVVIDAGPDGEIAQRCLERYGVSEVPLLILTHPHADHDGGVPGILSVVTPARAWVAASAADASAVRALEREGVTPEVPETGRSEVWGEVSLRVVSALHADASPSPNDDSIAVIAVAADTSVIALGDLELEGQEAVARVLGGPVSVDVVKVAHHGSAVQSTRLAAFVDAHVAVFSAGAGNRHGPPAPSTLELYGERAIVARTDECGSIEVARDPTGLRWSGCPTAVAR